MCGIVGYIGKREAAPIVLAGLKKLEYRGYDSFGVAIMGDTLQMYKQAGRIQPIPEMMGNIGIGHTRWATHGIPSDRNSHPFVDCKYQIAIVHNGIIENSDELREKLLACGHKFTSDTDSEVIVHLVEDAYYGDLVNAVKWVVKDLVGSYAILVLGEDQIVATRKSSPLVIGIGDGEMFVASDVLPILEYTNRVVYLNDGDIVDVCDIGDREVTTIQWIPGKMDMGTFQHYMLKEIYEQPRVFYDSIRSEITLPLTDVINIVGCGSSYYAGMVFKYLCEDICRLSVNVYFGSEFRYFPPPIKGTVIGITQSGETADTLVALGSVRECSKIAITNVMGSSITRVADSVILMQAGPEVSVAATKSFVAQLAILLQVINVIQQGEFDDTLLSGHQVIDQVLQTDLMEAVGVCKNATTMFYMSRGVFYPIALEGALKMKEIAYIHAEGFPSGELKHGAIALVTEYTPVVVICMPGDTHSVIMSNIKEMQARGAPIIAIGEVGDSELLRSADVMIPVPKTHPLLRVITTTVVLQLLAYYTAVALERDVDKPRNLAKSVTVE